MKQKKKRKGRRGKRQRKRSSSVGSKIKGRERERKLFRKGKNVKWRINRARKDKTKKVNMKDERQ